MNRAYYRRAAWVLFVLCCSISLLAQSNDGSSDTPVSLGDVARAVRKSKAPVAAPLLIDNDNLSKVMDEVESHRMRIAPKIAAPAPSADRSRDFALSSPDGTCSLSFIANAASANSPYVSEDLPPAELAKLEGPATVEGDDLEVAMYNGSAWELTEVTVGFTLERQVDEQAATLGKARLLPAVAEEPDPAEKKPSELTLIFHLHGNVLPLASNVFREKLGAQLAPDQDWHWAILGAKGVAPTVAPVMSK